MASINAQASGFYDDTSTWSGGVVPGPGDYAYCLSYTVTIRTNITVGRLYGSSSGQFTTSGTPTITADVYEANGLVLTSGATLYGNSHGSTASTNSYAVTVNAGAAQYGNSTGGTVNQARGTRLLNGGVQHGNSLGGSGSGSNTQGTVIDGTGGVQYGDATASATSSGTQGQSVGGRLVGGSYGGAGPSLIGLFMSGVGSRHEGDSHGGSGPDSHGTRLTASYSVHVGDSYGGGGVSAYGTYLPSTGVQIGDSHGGGGPDSHGTLVPAGAIQKGQSTGGAHSSAAGSFVAGVLVTTGITAATGPGVTLSGNARVVLHNGVTAGQLGTLPSAYVFDTALDGLFPESTGGGTVGVSRSRAVNAGGM